MSEYPKLSVNNQDAGWLLDPRDDSGRLIPFSEVLHRSGITREELEAMRDDFDNNDQSAAMENGEWE